MNHHLLLGILGSIAISGGVAGGAGLHEEPKKPVPRPPHNIRFEEDWSDPGDAPPRKRIRLGDHGLLSLGGQVRLRTELWSHFGFADEAGRDDVFGLSRVRLHADLYLGSRFRLFAEGKSALATTRDLPGGQRTLEVDSLEIHNAIAELHFKNAHRGRLTLRLGRQEMQFGKQRLVSPLDWSNTRPRTFDAARAILQDGAWRMDAFWGRQVRVRKYAFNPNSPANTFFGAYLAGERVGPAPGLDFYWLGLKRPHNQNEVRHTLGARIHGQGIQALDYDLEAAYQAGDRGPRKVRAWMAASQVGLTLPAVPRRPRLFVGLDYATGDRDPNDRTVGTFDQLFPLGHAYLGAIDVVGRQNVLDLSTGVGAPLLKGTTARFEAHFFWRAQEEDALYNAGGGVVRAGFPGSSLRVGEEVGVTLNHSLVRNTAISWGVYHFLAGDYLAETGPSDHTTFGFVSVQYTF